MMHFKTWYDALTIEDSFDLVRLLTTLTSRRGRQRGKDDEHLQMRAFIKKNLIRGIDESDRVSFGRGTWESGNAAENTSTTRIH